MFDDMGMRTVNSLPVFLFFPVENGVFILGQHLRLRGHFFLPPLNSLCSNVLLS